MRVTRCLPKIGARGGRNRDDGGAVRHRRGDRAMLALRLRGDTRHQRRAEDCQRHGADALRHPRRLRASTWDIPRFLRSYDETLDGSLVLRRGLIDRLTEIAAGR